MNSNEPVQISSNEDPSRPLAEPRRENYAKARAQGLKSVAAAKTAMVAPRTGRRYEADPQVGSRVRFLMHQAFEDPGVERRKAVREITIDRNDIIMGLADIAQSPFTKPGDRARVSAWLGLADIFLLRARCIEDLRKGVGWTEDETIEFHKTRIVPESKLAQIASEIGQREIWRVYWIDQPGCESLWAASLPSPNLSHGSRTWEPRGMAVQRNPRRPRGSQCDDWLED